MVTFDSWSLITEENVCDKSLIECCGNTPVAGVFITFCNVVGPGIVVAFEKKCKGNDVVQLSRLHLEENAESRLLWWD